MRGRLAFTLFGLVAVGGTATALLNGQPATAGSLPFRMVVPGVAVDSGAPLSGGVSAGHLSARNDGGLVVTGDVTNTSLSTITNVRIRVTASIGGTLVSRDTGALVDAIAPGAKAPFRVIYALPGATLAPVTAEVTGFDRAARAPSASFTFAGPYPFQVGSPDPKTGAIPYSTVLDQMNGQVTNTTGQSMSEIGIVVAIYDGNGNVAWVGDGAALQTPFQEAGDAPVLAAGQTGDFIVGVPKGLLSSLPGLPTFAGFVNATLN